MLEFSKKVLQEVSFDPYLFRKELKKAKELMGSHEQERLKLWALKHYGSSYERSIHQVFETGT
ncbi:MAG: hypothetical protein ABEH38_04020 [Flavobacteriales bacterium]